MTKGNKTRFGSMPQPNGVQVEGNEVSLEKVLEKDTVVVVDRESDIPTVVKKDSWFKRSGLETGYLPIIAGAATAYYTTRSTVATETFALIASAGLSLLFRNENNSSASKARKVSIVLSGGLAFAELFIHAYRMYGRQYF